jgi:uncharacterized protein YbjT (DUF2867 family)
MITITGASGKTGGKIASLLLDAGERIRVIGRTLEHLNSLAERGAVALAGDQSDENFLTATFKGADAAYVLIPPKFDTPDVRKHYNTFGKAAMNAIRKSGLKKLVFLSSLGAEHYSDVGPVTGLHDVEKMLGSLNDTDIVFLRAGYFYENTLMNIEMVKNNRIFGNPANPDTPILMVCTDDVAHHATMLLAGRHFRGHRIEDVFSERITYREITRIIGEKLDIPDLKFIQFSDEDSVKGMMSAGLSENLAKSYVEMAHALEKGLLTTTKQDPMKPNGMIRYKDFAEQVLSAMLEHA